MSATTPCAVLALSITLVGIGAGSTQQNLVLAVQNQVALRDMGAVAQHHGRAHADLVRGSRSGLRRDVELGDAEPVAVTGRH